MTEFDKLTVEQIEAIAGADDPDAMDRNARGAADLWSAYEYAKSRFGTHIEELRQYWSGATAQRFTDEAQVVHTDVDEMGTVLQAHTDALPVVAEAMRSFKTDAKNLADEYRAKRARHETEPPETAMPAIAELDREYGEKSRARLIEANDTYHRYNNGYLAPPKEFRGMLPDSAQPQLQSTPGPTAPAAPPATSGPPPTSVGPGPVVPGNPLVPPVGPPIRPVTTVPPPMTTRPVVGTPGPGGVRNSPPAMPRSTMVTSAQTTPRAVPRVGPASTIPVHPRTATVRPVTMATGDPRPGMTGRPLPPVTGRPVPGTSFVTGRPGVPTTTGVTGRHVPGTSALTGRPVTSTTAVTATGRPGVPGTSGVIGRSVPGTAAVPARSAAPRSLTSSFVATGRAPVPGRHPVSVVVPRAVTATADGRPALAASPPERGWTRSPLVRAATVPASAPTAPAPQPRPEPQWTRDPRVRLAPPAAEPQPVPEPRRSEWGRTPWVRPATGSAVYPARIDPRSEPEPTPTSSEADEPLLNPVTLSRLLSEATPAERERLLAVETAKLERIRAERAAKPAEH